MRLCVASLIELVFGSLANVLIIHGIGGDPNENWFPWLKKELEAQGHNAVVPAFPNADKPLLKEWLDHFDSLHQTLEADSVLIGHSLGAAFALRLLERLEHPIKAVFLIAPVSGPLDNRFDHLMGTFSHNAFDFDRIRKNCAQFFVYHADNDPYIPLETAEQLSKNLHATFRLIPSGGHLNAKAGYTSFEALGQEIGHVLSQL